MTGEELTSWRESRRRVLVKAIQASGLLLASGWLPACSRPAENPGSSRVSQAGSPWASGGTSAMRGPYPDPFRGPRTEPCVLTPALAQGPCHAATLTRRDISEGIRGLPMRLSLRVTRAGDCRPVVGASVDIWHAGPPGFYSAFPAGSICNPSPQDAATAHFGRGVQVTDADGRVDFDTVFPGWYPGRTVHVHVTVREGDQEYLTTQLFFDDALSDAIFAGHPDYAGRPARDTTNRSDLVLAGRPIAPFLLSTARMADGALQAWKAIALG